jgi:ferredoxin
METITINSNIINHQDTSSTILETLEKYGLNIRNQCRDGFCGSCRCKLISGEVTYRQEPIAYTHENEILICIAQPCSNIIIQNDY